MDNLTTFSEVCEYYNSIFPTKGIEIISLDAKSWGVICRVMDRGNFLSYGSIYLYPDFRGKNLYKGIAKANDLVIFTKKGCNLEPYLNYQGIEYVLLEDL